MKAIGRSYVWHVSYVVIEVGWAKNTREGLDDIPYAPLFIFLSKVACKRTALPHDEDVSALILDWKKDLGHHDENAPLVRRVDVPDTVHIGWIVPRIVGRFDVTHKISKLASTQLVYRCCKQKYFLIIQERMDGACIFMFVVITLLLLQWETLVAPSKSVVVFPGQVMQ